MAVFARFAIQVALQRPQYEINACVIPCNWTTGYFVQVSVAPVVYPKSIYGTEVFELNVNLRGKVIALSKCRPHRF